MGRINDRAKLNKNSFSGIKYTIWSDEVTGYIWNLEEILNDEYNIEYTDSIPIDWRVNSRKITNQYNQLSNDDQSTVDRQLSDLSNGYVYTNSPGNDKDDTHQLAKYDNTELMYEKIINPNNDRLVYYIGKPFYNKFKKVIEIYINVNSCSGHTFRGKNGQGNVRSFNEDNELDDDFWNNHQLSDLNW